MRMRNKSAFALPQGQGQAQEWRLLDTTVGLAFDCITPLRTGDQAKNRFANERLTMDESVGAGLQFDSETQSATSCLFKQMPWLQSALVPAQTSLGLFFHQSDPS